ncbi:MAG: DUF523 and DUF1722 domain-containing protein [Actinomycetota bacterium]
MPPTDALDIGVSRCLLGAGVRYDGGHKSNPLLLDQFAANFNLIPVCPEVEAGMGVPRETVRLAGSESELKMVGTESGIDHTEAMNDFAIRKVQELAGVQLCGYVFKSGSPSCGLEVPVQGGDATGQGLFASAVLQAFPDLPVIEEQALADRPARENFAEQVFAYSRLAQFLSNERSVGQLVMCHAQVRLQLDVHAPDAHSTIKDLFLRSAEYDYQDLCREYRRQFMSALSSPATAVGHFEVLKSVFAEVKPRVGAQAAKELARALQDYRLGTVSLAVPVTLLRHYVRVLEHSTLDGQTYLDPGPRELILRQRF